MSRSGEVCVRALAVVLALLVVLPRSVSAGESGAEAERLIRHGIELRRAHDDPGALREFQKAYELAHTPRAAAQLGLDEQALGRWEDAEQHVREALETESDPWVAKNRATLADALGIIQAHLGRVEVIGDPEGAEVSVNGRPVGKLPLSQAVPVSVGQVDVEVHAPGYEPAQRTVTLVAGQYQRIVLRLAKPASTVAAAVDVPPAAAAVTQPPIERSPAAPLVNTSDPPARGPSTARVAVKWSLAGLAVASLAVGVTFTLVERKNVSAFDTYQGCKNRDGMAVMRDGTTPVMRDGTTPFPECQPALDNYLLDEKVAIAGYVGAGALAVTWLILQLTEPAAAASHAEHARVTPLCGTTAARLGLSCAFRF